MRTTVVALAVLSLAPLSVTAQRPENGTQRIEAARARAAAAGIPAELLESRIAEGRAKGVSEERIAAAIERREAGLAKAQDAMKQAGTRPSAAELSAGADAAEAGVDAEALRTVIKAAREKGPEDRAMAVAVLGELARQGVLPEQAAKQVKDALARRDGALAKLPEQAAAARERRGPPEGAGRPSGVGGGRPSGVGGAPSGTPGGKPAGVPTAGQPGGGKPAGTPSGKPGGRP